MWKYNFKAKSIHTNNAFQVYLLRKNCYMLIETVTNLEYLSLPVSFKSTMRTREKN